MTPLNKNELDQIFEERSQLIIRYHIAKCLFAEPDPIKNSSEVSFRVPNEHAEQWIAQAIGGQRIGAGSYPIDVLDSEISFGCDIAVLTAKTLVSGELAGSTSGEKSIGQKFSDVTWAGGQSLDELFNQERIYEIAENSNNIFFEKFNGIKNSYPTIQNIYYFFLIIHSVKNKIYLSGLNLNIDNKQEVGNPDRVNPGNDLKSVRLDNFIDDRYGEVKTYKAKKRMELRLRPKNLVDDNLCLIFDTKKDRSNKFLRNFDKKELIKLFEKQSLEQNFNF